MYTKDERDKMILAMRKASEIFYSQAVHIGNHPFIEFTGLLNEYIQLCELANKQNIDFTQCNRHTGLELPMPEHCRNYINEKLECIFTGRIECKP